MPTPQTYMVDLYGDVVLVDGWIARLRADWMSLGWYDEPNRHRAFLPRDVARDRRWRPDALSGLSMRAVMDGDVLQMMRPATPRELSAGACVKFGRIGRAAGVRKSSVGQLQGDVADGYFDPVRDMMLVIALKPVAPQKVPAFASQVSLR